KGFLLFFSQGNRFRDVAHCSLDGLFCLAVYTVEDLRYCFQIVVLDCFLDQFLNQNIGKGFFDLLAPVCYLDLFLKHTAKDGRQIERSLSPARWVAGGSRRKGL